MRIPPSLAVSPSPLRGLSSSAPSESIVDRIVDRTALSANYLASGLSGGVGGLGAYGVSVLGTSARTVVSAWTNLWRTEALGPNLKGIGSLLAAPAVLAAAAVAIPISLVHGIYHGVQAVDPTRPRDFTVGAAGVQGFSKTERAWRQTENHLADSLDDMGSTMLEPGEKPLDIPLLKTAKTLGMTAASAAVGGAVGAACAVLSAGREAGTGLMQTVRDETLGPLGKVAAGAGVVIGAAAHGLTYGAGTALDLTGRGLVETWKQDSIVGGARAVAQRAGQALAAAVAPEQTLLQPVPPSAAPTP